MDYLALLLAVFIPFSFAAQCGGPEVGNNPSPIDDTEVWHLRAQVCNAPSCPSGQICTKTFFVKDDKSPRERVESGDITIWYYTQTGRFDQCWAALGNIISTCNRNGRLFGEWDYNGEAYWITNTIDRNQHTLTDALGQLTTGKSTFPMSQGTWMPSFTCVGGSITSGTQDRNWNWSTGSSWTVGGKFDFNNILGDLLKKLTGMSAGITGGKTWSEQTGGGVTTHCTAAPGKCIQPEGRQRMAYSFGFAVNTDWLPASGPTPPTIRIVSFSPYHLDAPLTDADGKTPIIDWNCDGPCPRGTFNPQCISVPGRAKWISEENVLVQQLA